MIQACGPVQYGCLQLRVPTTLFTGLLLLTATASACAAACGWAGHCLGDVCQTFNDCDGNLVCLTGRCNGSGENTPGPTPPPPQGCSWPSHCAGDPCQTADDCDGQLICKSGKCGTAEGTTPPGVSGQGQCPAGWYEAKLTVYDSWPYPSSPEWQDYSGGEYLGLFAYKETSAACNQPGEVLLTSWSTPDGRSGRIPAGCHWRHDWVANQKIAAVFKSASSPVTGINFNTQIAGKQIHVASLANARSGSSGMAVFVADTCGDADCGNCCTKNANKSASKFLIDLEKNALKAVFPGIKGFEPTRIRYIGRHAAYQGPAFDGASIRGYPSRVCFKLA